VPDEIDPVFLRRKFLLRQKHLSLSEKYYVWDEGGQELLFIERPAMLLRNLLAAFAAILAFAVVAGLCALLAAAAPDDGPVQGLLITAALLGGVFAAVLAAVVCSPKRHVYFYRDDTKRERMLTVEQDRKFTPVVATYTVKDAAGTILARLRKNYLYNIFRKRWTCSDPDGKLLSLIQEDSLLLSILRRFLGPFFGLLRTNFVLFKGGTEEVVGEFNRKLTLLDRYVLDLSADDGEHLDRRVALAIGVMLDTGERR